MASTAISAQGSIVSIGTATGAAKNITAISATSPCIATSTAHGLTNGDIVTLAAVGGMTQLNGNTVTIGNVTANTFALVGIDATAYTTYTSGGTATPVTWTPIGNVKDFSGFDGAAAIIDVTNLSSTAKEKRLGLVDNGQFTMNLDQDNSDPGQIALRAARTAGTIKNFKLTLPNANTASFSAFVQKISDAGAVDGIVKNACTLILSGAVTRA